MKTNAHKGKHISYFIIQMKTFNVPQFNNGFYCYFESTCSSFHKVVKLFTLSYLHLESLFIKMNSISTKFEP